MKSNRLLSMHLYKKYILYFAVFLSFLSIAYEFPASVIAGVWASYGVTDAVLFNQYRLVFAAFVIFVCLVNLLLNLRSVFRLKEFWVYVLILLNISVVLWINREEYAFLSVDDVHSVSALEYWMPIIFKYFLFFFLGINIVCLAAFRSVLLLVLIVAAIVVMQYANYESLRVDPRDFVSGANKGIYLTMGDGFAISALLVLAFFNGIKLNVVISLVSALVLFFIGSRTSFMVFVFVVCMLFTLKFKLRWSLYYLLICASIAVIFVSLDFEELADRNSRMISIFTEYDEDNSVNGRRRFAKFGWEDIRKDPIFGRFGGQRDSGSFYAKDVWQSYMHNIASYWRQFGIITFILICFTYIRYIQGVLTRLGRIDSHEFRIYFLLGSFIIIESIFSRSFAFSQTHIVHGMLVSMYMKYPPTYLLSAYKKGVILGTVGTDAYSYNNKRRRRKKKRILI